MSEKKRTLMTSTQKAKVALEAVKGSKTVNGIAQEYSVHPTQVGLWKKALLENASQLFDIKRGPKTLIHKVIRNACTPRLASSTWSWNGLKKSPGSAFKPASGLD